MKKRFLAAGAVILALGIYLGNLFQGPGLGEGDTDSGEPSADTQVNLGADSNFTPTPRTVSNSSEEDTESADVLTLVVLAEGYAIQKGSDEQPDFDEFTLDEIVQKAANADPDTNGLRVRLRYSQDAEMVNVEALSRRLQAAPEEGGAGLIPEEMIKDSAYID